MKILIATDGSEYSDHALHECAKFVTSPAVTEMKVISVFQNPYVFSGEPFAISGAFIQEMADASKSQAVSIAEAARKSLTNYFGDSVTISTDVVGPGVPEERILETAEAWGADLIVVGSRGQGLLGRMLGSVSDALVHHAKCSVLVARPDH